MSEARGELRHLATAVHGRYLLRRGRPAAPLLLGFHGYGETADAHFAQLVQVPGLEAWTLCAVQALHPFYDRRTNQVVASWMTKQDRELAIADNLAYVGGVAAAVRRECSCGAEAYLGFSQGAAMAYRAAARAPGPLAVVALGGDVPPDVAARDLHTLAPVLIGRGARDEWYTAEKLGKDLAALGAAGAQVESILLEAGHEWNEEFRGAAGVFLSRWATSKD